MPAAEPAEDMVANALRALKLAPTAWDWDGYSCLSERTSPGLQERMRGNLDRAWNAIIDDVPEQVRDTLVAHKRLAVSASSAAATGAPAKSAAAAKRASAPAKLV